MSRDIPKDGSVVFRKREMSRSVVVRGGISTSTSSLLTVLVRPSNKTGEFSWYGSSSSSDRSSCSRYSFTPLI